MTGPRSAAVIVLIVLNCLIICESAWCQGQIYNGKREKAIMQIPRAYTASVPKALKFMEDQFTCSGSRRSGNSYAYVRKVSYVNLKSIENRMAELIKKRDSQGRTLLHLAAYYGSKEVTILLISSGADINAKEGANMTPLQYAEGRGNNDIADILRSKGQK